jgi:hypothetical protein
MTISFENDNDLITYAPAKIIEHARRTQQNFIAQCVWWLASTVALEQELISYIDNLHSRIETTLTSGTTQSTLERAIKDKCELRQDQILEGCEDDLAESRRLRDIATLKSKGKTQTGRINPTPISKKALRKKDRYKRKPAIPAEKESNTAHIDKREIQRRKETGECLRCAWPSDWKGAPKAHSCI